MTFFVLAYKGKRSLWLYGVSCYIYVTAFQEHRMAQDTQLNVTSPFFHLN